MPALRVGLTGGIGSGKSTVLQILAQQGAAAIDADAISRATTAEGGTAIAAIVAAFGPTFITVSGALDRDRMRDHVFANPGARRQLEQIIHPLVRRESEHRALAAVQAGAPCVVFDIPLLVESGQWRSLVDRVWVVDCSPQTQLARVVARNGLKPEEVQAIMDAQAKRSQRLAAADMVIYNDGISLAQLRDKVVQAGSGLGL